MPQLTPVLFIGHGDPMNALRDNAFTQHLRALGETLSPRPQSILVVSAHWLTKGSWVNEVANPETIYDFGGFPDALYRVVYAAPGDPNRARRTASLDPRIGLTSDWGLDHGAWTILRHLIPQADIPVFQLSIDYHQPPSYHLKMAQNLRVLRSEGVLIVGSGNVVHNLRLAFEVGLNAPAYPWAIEFDQWVKENLEARNWDALVNWESTGDMGRLSVPTPDHYYPLLYTLGVVDPGETISFAHEEVISSMSMRCVRFG